MYPTGAELSPPVQDLMRLAVGYGYCGFQKYANDAREEALRAMPIICPAGNLAMGAATILRIPEVLLPLDLAVKRATKGGMEQGRRQTLNEIIEASSPEQFMEIHEMLDRRRESFGEDNKEGSRADCQ